MNITTTEQILLIVLASFLALFLVLGCVVLIKVIQVLNHIKSITDKAEKLADTAEHVGEFFKYSAGPAAIVKLVTSIHEQVFKKKGRGKNES
jgi:hypothetical protein